MWTIDRTNEARLTIDDLSRESDRGAAIIAASLLEREIEICIKEQFRARDDAVENRIFKGLGPLATFSAKIDVGYLLGLYPDFIRREIIIIKDIRNEFAHRAAPRDFNSQRIKNLTENLPTPYVLNHIGEWHICEVCAATPAGKSWRKWLKDIGRRGARKKDTPRNRYECSIQFYIFALIMANQHPGGHFVGPPPTGEEQPSPSREIYFPQPRRRTKSGNHARKEPPLPPESSLE